MQHDRVPKKFNFDLLTASPGWGGIGGFVSKIFATMLLFVIPFNLICKIYILWVLPSTQVDHEQTPPKSSQT